MTQPLVYTEITHAIRVSVYPIYLDGQSKPDENEYIWAYHVMIENMSDETVQLKKRHWKITNAYGQTQEIHGEGVIGQIPIIEPGETYEYTSGVPLTTPSGIMLGFYTMETSRGGTIDVTVPAFSLDSPYQAVSLN